MSSRLAASTLLVAATLLAAAPCCVGASVGVRTPVTRMQQSMGARAPGAGVVLRYRVRNHDGDWRYEIVALEGRYAESRSREDGSAEYAFGFGPEGAWLRTAGRQAVEVGEAWSQIARARHALFSLKFVHPTAGDVGEVLTRTVRSWEYVFTPSGGRGLTLTLGWDGVPVAFDLLDTYDRVDGCEDVKWADGPAGPLLQSAACRAIIAGRGATRAHMELQQASGVTAEILPSWSLPGEIRRRAVHFSPVDLPFDDTQSPRIEVRVGDGQPMDFVLDSGAFTTVMSKRAAQESGIVLTGETPYHVKPPWLTEGTYRAGLADRLSIGGVESHAVPVLVMQEDGDLGEASGLVGADFFERAIVEVDGPAQRIRIRERGTWTPPPDATLLRMAGSPRHGMQVRGEILGVAQGAITLDTGADLEVVVQAWQMKVKHPRRPDSDVYLSRGESSSSPNYATEIDGLRLGPYEFPAMDAVGRDRERERMGGGIALVGMGVMRHFRVTFDAGSRVVYLQPGDSYRVLHKAGIEVDPRGDGPTVTRVVPSSTADRARAGGRHRTRGAGRTHAGD